MQYHTHHASFELPPQLKDKSVHMFTLGNEGPSDFSVVMSNAPLQPGDTLFSFAERLIAGLREALSGFNMLGSTERRLSEELAIELTYYWQSEGKLLHQRQVIALIPDEEPTPAQAMLIAATCLNAFSDEWNDTFDRMLDSVSLRHRLEPVPSALVVPPGPIEATVFALSERRRTLHAFADVDEAARKTDAREVEQDAWTFFDAAGAPLYPNFIVPNTGTLWRKAGAYVLHARTERGAPTLRERLHQAAVFVCNSPSVRLASLGDVRAALDALVER